MKCHANGFVVQYVFVCAAPLLFGMSWMTTSSVKGYMTAACRSDCCYCCVERARPFKTTKIQAFFCRFFTQKHRERKKQRAVVSPSSSFFCALTALGPNITASAPKLVATSIDNICLILLCSMRAFFCRPVSALKNFLKINNVAFWRETDLFEFKDRINIHYGNEWPNETEWIFPNTSLRVVFFCRMP